MPDLVEQWSALVYDDSWNDQLQEHQNQLCGDAWKAEHTQHKVPHIVPDGSDIHAARLNCVGPPAGQKGPRIHFTDAQIGGVACHTPISYSSASLWGIVHLAWLCCIL